jgi:hypothetical protein
MQNIFVETSGFCKVWHDNCILKITGNRPTTDDIQKPRKGEAGLAEPVLGFTIYYN